MSSNKQNITCSPEATNEAGRGNQTTHHQSLMVLGLELLQNREDITP